MPPCKASLRSSYRPAICMLLASLMVAEPSALANGPMQIRAKDVTLLEGGLLQGRIQNTSAQPVPDVAVQVFHGEKVVASTKSNSEGRFRIQGLRNGSHLIQVAGTQHQVRFWSESAAPPAAIHEVPIVVSQTPAVPGPVRNVPVVQSGFYNTTAAAWLLIGTGVAVTLGTALGGDDSEQPASP